MFLCKGRLILSIKPTQLILCQMCSQFFGKSHTYYGQMDYIVWSVCANPFTQTVDDEAWNGKAYPLTHPYVDGFDISTLYPHWDVEDVNGGLRKIESPKEFRHTLSTLINCLIASVFMLTHMQEIGNTNVNPEPGNREHFRSIAPPYLLFWSCLRWVECFFCIMETNEGSGLGFSGQM